MATIKFNESYFLPEFAAARATVNASGFECCITHLTASPTNPSRNLSSHAVYNPATQTVYYIHEAAGQFYGERAALEAGRWEWLRNRYPAIAWDDLPYLACEFVRAGEVGEIFPPQISPQKIF